MVYCHDSELKEYPATAMRLMRHESQHQLLEIRDKDLAEKLKMKPGHLYGYYNPSYINGYEQYVGQDINFPFLQAFEGICREEL